MKVGFIGAGKIGTSVIKGLLHAKVAGSDIFVFDGGHQSSKTVANKYSLNLINDYADFKGCSVVVVAVGGPAVPSILKELGNKYQGVIVSTGGGDLEKVNQELPLSTRFAKIVPNTPVQLGEGITIASFAKDEKQATIDAVKDVFAKMGDVYVVPDSLSGIYGTVTGCAPAFVDMMIEALSDAAVQNGVKRNESYAMIEKMIQGTVDLAISNNKLPEELKDEVTTPGGSTIRGVVKLEEAGFRNALIQAINASAN